MEVRYLLHILRRHWLFLSVASVVAFLLGLAATYVLPEKYEATTKILIRPREEVNLGPQSKAMMDFPVSINIPAESMSKTFAEIMSSEAIAIRVVDALHIDKMVPEPDPRWYMRVYYTLKDWAKITIKYTWDFVRYGRVETRDPYWKAVDDVMDGLSAEPVADTYLFTLSATWDNPKLAALIADNVAKIFVDYNMESSQNEDGTSAHSLGERADVVQGELAEARSRLQAFNDRTQAPKLDYQLSLVLQKLSEFEGQRQETDKNLREVDAELKTLSAQLQAEPDRIRESTLMSKNPVTQALEQDLARYQVDLAALEKTHLPTHPVMKALLAKIEKARSEIDSQQEQIRVQDNMAVNPIHEELMRKVLDRRATRDLLASRRMALDATVANYQREVDRFSDEQKELARLTLDVNVLESEYVAVRKQYGEARLSAVQEISEIRILSPAMVPLYPRSPIKLYYAGGALVVGFLLALSLLLLWDYTEPTMVTAEEVEQLMGIPVLASVPRGALPAGTALLLGKGASSASFAFRTLGEDFRPLEGRSDDE
jgi:polysaccharide biosynthesis transport protein